jgi:hypothetical protein
MIFVVTLVGAPMVMWAGWKYFKAEWMRYDSERRRRALFGLMYMVGILILELGTFILFGIKTSVIAIVAVGGVMGAFTWVRALVLGIRGTPEARRRRERHQG